MGLFSFLDKPFRTGRTSAAKDAAKASQQSQADFEEFAELFKPSIERGTESLGALEAYSSIDGFNDLYSDIQGSDLAQTMIDDRTTAVEGALASSGLRRSGTRLKEAAKIPTEVISSLMDTIIGNTQNVAQIGLGQGGNVLGGLTGALNASNSAAAYNAIPGDNRAATTGGLLSLGGSIFGSLLSDVRLKKNIKKVGEYGPLDIFEWDWVSDEIKGGMNTGFTAQQVAEIYPAHVHEISIDGFPLLTVDYDSVFKEIENVQ